MSSVAILVDGGFFLKRLPTILRMVESVDSTVLPKVDSTVLSKIDAKNPSSATFVLRRLITTHLECLNQIEGRPTAYSLLYRSFFYDATPYVGKGHLPISEKQFYYQNSPETKFRLALHEKLRRMSRMSVRLGEVRKRRDWILRAKAQERLLKREITVDELTDRDFVPELRQKAVDMRIGIDIVALTLKRQVSTIVLVSGDSAFVPASKLARREGVKVVLDPLLQKVRGGLYEHVDELRPSFPHPNAQVKTP